MSTGPLSHCSWLLRSRAARVGSASIFVFAVVAIVAFPWMGGTPPVSTANDLDAGPYEFSDSLIGRGGGILARFISILRGTTNSIADLDKDKDGIVDVSPSDTDPQILAVPKGGGGMAASEALKVAEAKGAQRTGILPGNMWAMDVSEEAESTGITPQLLVKRLQETGKFEVVGFNRILRITYTPNDPEYPNQWHLPKIGAPQAWDTAQGQNTTVAILDTGVDCTHRDLSCVAGWDAILNVPISATANSDVHGHGTKTAGTAAATGDNAQDVAGVGYKAKIMPIRVADAGGWSTSGLVGWGMWKAGELGASSINVSLGPPDTITDFNANRVLERDRVLTAMAIGNDGRSTDWVGYEAPIIVSSTNSADARSSFSNYGKWVDLAAPGEGIVTTTRGGGTSGATGTSFSTPIVAGAIALLRSVCPAAMPWVTESALRSSAVDLGPAGRDYEYGFGRINIGAAVLNMLGVCETLPTPPFAPSGLTVTQTGPPAQLRVQWTDNSNNETGFQIAYRSGSQSMPLGSFITVGPNVTSYNFSTLIWPDFQYFFRIRAFNDGGESAYSNIAYGTTAGNPRPPRDLAVVPAGSTQLNLTWADTSTDEINFLIFRATDENIDNFGNISYTQIATLGPNVQAYSDIGLTTGKRYYYTVKSANTVGQSDFSNIANAIPGGTAEIQVVDKTADVPDGGTVSFGSTTAGTPLQKTFTVKNVGGATLTFAQPTVPAGFILSIPFEFLTLQPGETSNFSVRLTAAAVGSYRGEVSFGNSDSDENPFNFTVDGTVIPPSSEIKVLDGTTDVPDGTGTVSYGTTLVGTPVDKTFTVKNLGTANLTLSEPISVPAGYTVTASFGTTTLVPGAQTTFTVRLNAAALGTYNGEVSFGNNDSNENPFNFTVTGLVSNRVIIDDGDSGYSMAGNWILATGQGYQNDVHYSAAGAGSDTADWTFTVTPGVYRVSATWSIHPNRATNAPYTVFDGATSLGTVRVNQEIAPNDLQDDGAWWEDLGTFNITGTSLKVRLSDDANEYVIADGVRIEKQ